MVFISERPRSTSGIPLGGIGTGSIELRADGEFHEWQIANVDRWAKVCGNQKGVDDGENLSGALSFYIRTQGENSEEPVRMRRLGFGFGHGQDREEYNYRMFSWLKTIQQINYTGDFPSAKLEYVDEDLPVDVSLEAVSPFVPHNHQVSGTPGFYLKFKLKNKTQQKLEVSLAGKLKNILSEEQRTNKVIHSENQTYLFMENEQLSKQPNNGNVCFSVEGSDLSWISGEYSDYMNEFVAYGDLGVTEESFLFNLRRCGKLPKTNIDQKPNQLNQKEAIEHLTEQEVDRCLSKMLENAFAKDLMDRLLLIDPNLYKELTTKRQALAYLKEVHEALLEESAWGDGALCSTVSLLPGETKEVAFTFSWYFPNLISQKGEPIGHMYENYFTDAQDVCKYLNANRPVIEEKAHLFSQTLKQTSFDSSFAQAWTAHLATLIKNSWWTKRDEFGIWEGLGTCGFHTTDITYHGSFGLVQLFPALQKKQMLLGSQFQREDGRVPHFFTPDFSSVDDGFDRVDMNSQFVLLVCRDYLATGDREYLLALWPNILSAMENLKQLDSDNDGLPDLDTKRNTYDSWNFFGNSSYVSGLWLAAVRAFIFLSQSSAISQTTDEWQTLLDLGIKSYEEKLWNQKYFNLWEKDGEVDECCMTAQLDGEWFIRLIGLKGNLPDEKVRTSLATIYEENYSQEGGLVNATYPKGAKPTIHTFMNTQAEANWTGIEYMFSSFLILMNKVEQAQTIVKNVDARYQRLGVYWNHSECGDHYYRPLSSWALLQSLTVFSYDAVEKCLQLATREADFNAPWVTSTGWGQLSQDEGRWEVYCQSGQLIIRQVDLPESIKTVCIKIFSLSEDGAKENQSLTFENGCGLPERLVIKENERFILEVL
ncbi:hypothetical protein IGI37_002998 [Enterococcus sp. AZ194]|uniref:GH116 family glycosyl hydrolase n=1 Tax=Enterococcus sp. AZ194 TaxID=2774629 RepID=UPI003F292DB5